MPHLWHYDALKPDLMEACELITAKEAERRVLVLENPALPGESRITKSLFGGLQIILPGEIAAPHRHTQAALRFVLEGEGAYTSVDGERTFMRPGDFVITPRWTWHDHGNVGKGPMVWLDGLDMHMIKLFEASFREGSGSDAAGEVTRPEGDSEARYGGNLLPVDDSYSRPTSPMFNYRYDRTREALEQMRRRDEWSPWHGLKLKYANPKTGDYAIPTIATFIQLLPKGFKTAPYRSTASTVFVVRRGRRQKRHRRGRGRANLHLGTARHFRGAELGMSGTRRRATRCCSAIPTRACTRSSAFSAKKIAGVTMTRFLQLAALPGAMTRPWRLTKFSYYLDFAIYPLLIVALILLKIEFRGLSLVWFRWWVAGFVAWTLIEYWLHRLVFHGVPPAIQKMHLQHHDNPSAWIGVPVWYSLVLFTIAGAPLFALLGLDRGTGVLIGLLIGYTFYIGVHDAAHHRSSYLWPWFSRLRANHLRHHYHDAQAGFGVTSDVWDRLFGTKR